MDPGINPGPTENRKERQGPGTTYVEGQTGLEMVRVETEASPGEEALGRPVSLTPGVVRTSPFNQDSL